MEVALLRYLTVSHSKFQLLRTPLRRPSVFAVETKTKIPPKDQTPPPQPTTPKPPHPPHPPLKIRPVHAREVSQGHIVQQIHAANVNAVGGLRDGLVVDVLEERRARRQVPHLAAVAPVAVACERGLRGVAAKS